MRKFQENREVAKINRTTNRFRSLCALVWPCFGSRWRNDSGSNSVFRRGLCLFVRTVDWVVDKGNGKFKPVWNFRIDAYIFFSSLFFFFLFLELSNYRSNMHDSKPKIIHCLLKLEQRSPVSSAPFACKSIWSLFTATFLYERIVDVIQNILNILYTVWNILNCSLNYFKKCRIMRVSWLTRGSFKCHNTKKLCFVYVVSKICNSKAIISN